MQEAALASSRDVDPVARQIGAVNTLIRQPDGSYKGYNTDWVAAIEAIEKKMTETNPGVTHTRTCARTHTNVTHTHTHTQTHTRGGACYWISAVHCAVGLEGFKSRFLLGMCVCVCVCVMCTCHAAPAGKSPLAGKTVCVVGAGGAGRALAFGAASKWVTTGHTHSRTHARTHTRSLY